MKVIPSKIIGHDQLLFKSGPLYWGTNGLLSIIDNTVKPALMTTSIKQ